MGLRVLTVDVVEVVGGAEPEAELLPQLDQALVDGDLLGHAVALDFQQVAVLAEDVAVGGDGRPGLLDVARRQPGGDLPGQAAREGDQAL